MSGVQRWNVRITMTPIGPKPWHVKDERGEWVRYEDHEAAVAAAVESARAEAWRAFKAQGVRIAAASRADALREAHDDITENVGRWGDVNAETVLAHIRALPGYPKDDA